MLKPISHCRACDGRLLPLLDLGKQYLADFRSDTKRPPKHPLEIVICEACKLVQLRHNTPRELMYHERYGFKSGISDSIKDDLDSVVTEAFQWISDPSNWLDIASNDGTLLSFVPKDVFRVGVDPVKFLCEEAEQHADQIVNDYYTAAAVSQFYDVITSISCFYDMPDPSKFVEDVRTNLDPKGIWIIQQNYLLATMQLGAVDNFCHEHLEYYTLLSLERLLNRHGLEVIDVSTSTINGGSLRTVVAHKGAFEVQESVWGQRSLENDAGLDTLSPYTEFAARIGQKLDALFQLVDGIKAEGKTVCLLAASTRGSTIWQSANLGPEQLEYAVERNPAKVGRWFSPIGIPIVSENYFHDHPTDYAIIGPWFFADEIMEREKDYLEKGGKFVAPLPELKVYGNV